MANEITVNRVDPKINLLLNPIVTTDLAEAKASSGVLKELTTALKAQEATIANIEALKGDVTTNLDFSGMGDELQSALGEDASGFGFKNPAELEGTLFDLSAQSVRAILAQQNLALHLVEDRHSAERTRDARQTDFIKSQEGANQQLREMFAKAKSDLQAAHGLRELYASDLQAAHGLRELYAKTKSDLQAASSQVRENHAAYSKGLLTTLKYNQADLKQAEALANELTKGKAEAFAHIESGYTACLQTLDERAAEVSEEFAQSIARIQAAQEKIVSELSLAKQPVIEAYEAPTEIAKIVAKEVPTLSFDNLELEDDSQDGNGRDASMLELEGPQLHEEEEEEEEGAAPHLEVTLEQATNAPVTNATVTLTNLAEDILGHDAQPSSSDQPPVLGAEIELE